jgi:hypothetical protein
VEHLAPGFKISRKREDSALPGSDVIGLARLLERLPKTDGKNACRIAGCRMLLDVLKQPLQYVWSLTIVFCLLNLICYIIAAG